MEDESEPNDPIQEVFGVVDAAIEKIWSDITCPKCGEKFAVSQRAGFKENTFTMRLTVEDGHFLQAETIGGVLNNLAKLFKARAKDMGVKMELLIPEIKFSGNEIEIKAISVIAGKQPDQQQA